MTGLGHERKSVTATRMSPYMSSDPARHNAAYMDHHRTEDGTKLLDGTFAKATCSFGIESQIPWLPIDDDLPRARTEDGPVFISAKEAVERGEG